MSGPASALSGSVVFFTGAGISVGAGLPTYRGTGGLYESSSLTPPSAEDVTRERLPALWDRFRPRLRAFDDLAPSRAHRSIAGFEGSGSARVTVVTQNVDGLHSRAGSTRVHELHGSLRTMRCLAHGHRHAVPADPWSAGEAPACPTCGDVCRPNIVLFGETLPAQAFSDATAAMREADTVVAVGTSALVYPAAFLIGPEYTAGSRLVWINPETAPPNSTWTWRQGTADDEVERLLSP